MSADKDVRYKYHSRYADMASHVLEADLEQMISLTPTGEKRNALTEANIRRMQMRDALDKAEKL